MSYDINIIDPETRKVIQLDKPHTLAGGTYALGGIETLWLNVTYNYGKYFVEALGIDGVRTLYGKTVRETIPILKEAIKKLGDEPPTNDYWEATPGNAREALQNLLSLARLAPDHGVWQGD